MRKLFILLSAILIIIYSFIAGACYMESDWTKTIIYALCAICWAVGFYLQTIMDIREHKQ